MGKTLAEVVERGAHWLKSALEADYEAEAIRQLSADNKALREALFPVTGVIGSITLGAKLQGRITEQEAVDLINMVNAYQRELAATTLAATDPNRVIGE